MTPQRRRRALSLEELELWLASDHAPAKGGWNVSAVDGLIAGIAVSPEPIEPKEWTRLIFGTQPLGPDGEAALQAMLDRHDAVAKILAKVPASYAPLFMRTDEGVVLTQDWAAGFLAAIRLRLEAWRPLLEAAETSRLLLPILVHIPAPDLEGHIAELPASARQHLAEAYHHIPTAVAALYDLRHRSAATERHAGPRRHCLG
jgi:uncharacterized protein